MSLHASSWGLRGFQPLFLKGWRKWESLNILMAEVDRSLISIEVKECRVLIALISLKIEGWKQAQGDKWLLPVHNFHWAHGHSVSEQAKGYMMYQALQLHISQIRITYIHLTGMVTGVMFCIYSSILLYTQAIRVMES